MKRGMETQSRGPDNQRPLGHASRQQYYWSQRDLYPNDGRRFQFPPRFRGWHRRARSPSLKWYKEYTVQDLKSGRVLMIDYAKKDKCKEGMRKVVAEEINSLDGLRQVYNNHKRDSEPVLRVFHVQNAPWATHFLLQKFNIDSRDSLIGTDFGKWIKYKTERKTARPVLNGKTWRTQHDPWRGISRTAFGVDYLKQYPVSEASREQGNDGPSNKPMKNFELNRYDEEDNPIHGWDVYVQRLGVYIQQRDTTPASPPDIESPYYEADGFSKGDFPKQDHDHRPRLESLDNGNVIIIFEGSCTGSIEDTLIPARGHWEARWRRLPFYLAFESHDVSNDQKMMIECMKMIVQDIFRATAEAWETLLDICYTHVNILEDKINEQPADESRAPELFINTNMFLKVEKLIYLHIDVAKEMRNNLIELNADDEEVDDNWLDTSPADFERLSNLVQEDLVKPTANLADLMYKSVGIRDSRHSLQLGTSMWRLSWITFIFLPLTFMVGFFGMNVDTFKDEPSIKWYFIVAVPFMLSILALWFILKHYWARRRQTPYQRGIYEHLFHDLSNTYPRLWTRSGPRSNIHPSGFLDRLKWRLITHWAQPSRTIALKPLEDDDDVDDILGSFSRLKRYWMRTWTGEIIQNQSQTSGDAEVEAYDLMERGGASSTSNPVSSTTQQPASSPPQPPQPQVQAQQEEEGQQRLFTTTFLKLPLARPNILRAGIQDQIRPSSQNSAGTGSRNSGILVEEQNLDWLKPLFGQRRRKSPLRQEEGTSGLGNGDGDGDDDDVARNNTTMNEEDSAARHEDGNNREE